jgi:diacylglycerol kinase family enzyme
MQRIGIIVNPHAKFVRKSRIDIPALYGLIGGEFADVRTPSSFGELDEAITSFRESSVDCIGVSGGDGTLHQALTRAIRLYAPDSPPPILILKSGTMDNVARTIALKGKGPDILKRMIAAFKQGKTPAAHRRDTIKVGERYGFLFGAGLTSNFLEAAYEGDRKGFLKNAEVIARAVAGGVAGSRKGLLKRLNAKVIADGRALPFNDVLGMLAGTVEHVGMGFSPMPRAVEKDGTFQLIVSGISPMKAVFQMLRLMRGRPLRGEANFNDLVSRLEIVSGEPFRYTLDGDLYTADKTLLVETGPPVHLVEV